MGNGTKSDMAEPCVFLKFNKIYNWVPTPLDPKDEKWRDKMPEDLRKKIALEEDKNMVWIDCFGRYPADKESARFEYPPRIREYRSSISHTREIPKHTTPR